VQYYSSKTGRRENVHSFALSYFYYLNISLWGQKKRLSVAPISGVMKTIGENCSKRRIALEKA